MTANAPTFFRWGRVRIITYCVWGRNAMRSFRIHLSAVLEQHKRSRSSIHKISFHRNGVQNIVSTESTPVLHMHEHKLYVNCNCARAWIANGERKWFGPGQETASGSPRTNNTVDGQYHYSIIEKSDSQITAKFQEVGVHGGLSWNYFKMHK